MTLKVGVIGSGAISELVHLPAYRGDPRVDLVGVCDINEGRAKRIAKQFDVKTYFTDYSELLEQEEIDAVSICTPNHLHREQAIAAAGAGKHILLEKPMAMNIKECDEILRVCKKADVKLMIGANVKFDPLNQKVKNIIDEGIIGKIFHITSHLAFGGPYEAWPSVSEWFFDEDKVGGGCLIDLGSHTFDFFRWIAGDVSSVCAIGGSIRGKGKGEDNVMVLLTFKNNALGEFDASWTYKGVLQSTEILGSEGGIFIGQPPSSVSIYTEKKIPDTLRGTIQLQTPITAAEILAFTKKKIVNFVDAIVEDEDPMVTGEDGRAAVEIVQAGYESMRTGKKIGLPLK